ncbi:NADP-dependent oxidoreductase domain-containing protein [Aspergillus cavernicola]|uniref:NADP-dependent oxidoreductase domain-containing protein n=1 Tax=Aspergillus cavernicola TaxID=176166 RepID=A0ABR4HGP7_9EURO
MAAVPHKSLFPVVLGTVIWGYLDRFEGATVNQVDEVSHLLDIFQSHGHTDVDTARIYGAGSAEEILAQAKWQERGLNVRAKLYPTKGKPLGHLGTLYTYSPEDIRRGFFDSLKALNVTKLDIWILYAPDRTVPIEETLREVNKLHEEGYFNRLGISNYQSWEVAQIVEVCERNGWVKPSLCQGLYNVLQRAIEPELIPCLRHYQIPLHVGQPTCGGFLSSQYRRDFLPTEHQPRSRFDPKMKHGLHHRSRYWNERYFEALDSIREVGKKHNLSEIEIAFRWLSHHSQLKAELGDAIMICVSNAEQLEEDLVALEAGPLPDEVVVALDTAYTTVKPVVGVYHH